MKTLDSTLFEDHLRQRAADMERLLSDLLDSTVRDDEIVRPNHLLAAMRHGTLNGGKRLRPFLVQESALLFGGDRRLLRASVRLLNACTAIP